MTDQQWRRALELYETVADLPVPAAQALLQSASDEPAVVHKVNEILSETGEEDVVSVRQPSARYAGIAIGRYDVIDLLGRGSTGEVYAGRDRELGRRVALKIMSAEYATLRSSSQRFLREAQASSALNHPNIVTIHEVITFDASEEQAQNGHAEAAGTARALCALPVIVMELVEGKPLRALCGNPMPVDAVVPLAVQIMRALAVAHASGIVHRDLKPENVIVRPDGYVKVLDFGLARRSFLQASAVAGGGSSTEGLPVGTLRYMSPEQCRGESATAASDVFAAGIVLYEMLAGRHPFAADSPLDTAHAIAWIEPRPLNNEKQGLARLVHSMLAKDAAARPSSDQALKALATCLEELAVTPVKNRPALWLYAALIVSLLAAGVFWWKKESPRTDTVLREPDFKIVALANLLGTEGFPDPSPDGTRVVFKFSGQNSSVSHIYVKQLDASKLTQLTNDTLSDSEPLFSPDGSKIAFLRQQNGRLNVMIMPAAGGIEQKVSDISDTAISLRIMSWDAQGRHLIVSQGLGGKAEVQIALFSISVDTGVQRQITFPQPGQIDCMPVVSPDWRNLGFARLNDGGSGLLWVMPLAPASTTDRQRPMRRLIASTALIRAWNWSPNGGSLLVSRMLNGRNYLWRYSLNKGVSASAPVRVAGLDDEVTQTSVSRAADRFFYTGPSTESFGIWSYPLAPASAPGQRFIASAKADADARYSPDGKNIAFASARAGFGQVDLWMCARDGSKQRQIATFGESGAHNAGSPSWSPNGRWIAFDAGLPGKTNGIYLLDVLGGEPKRLTKSGTQDGVPSWSSDGKWIYYSSNPAGRRDIWKLPFGGGTPVQVTHDAGFESYESPDGKFLYYTRREGPGIRRMALPDGKPEVVAGLEAFSGRYWEGSSKGIYFVTSSKARFLEFFQFSNQRVTRIRELPEPWTRIYRGLAVSPDGRNALYVQRDPGRMNIMVVNNFH